MDEQKDFMNEAGQAPDVNETPEPVLNDTSEPAFNETMPAEATPMATAAPVAPGPAPEHVLAGIGGAFLFSLGGVLIYTVIYQWGFIAWVTVTITYALASFGYRIFCGNRQTKSLASGLVPILVTIFMMFVSEYVAVVVFCYGSWKEFGVTLMETAKLVPQIFMEDPEARADILKDLLVIVFIAVALLGVTLFRLIKFKKAEKDKQQEG